MRPRLSLSSASAALSILVASVTVFAAACGPTIDPAAQSDLDRSLAQLPNSEETYPPSESFLPMAFVVGQWTQHRVTDDKGRASLLTYKLVGQENGAYWLEISRQSYEGHETTKMLIAMLAGRDPAGMEIRAIRVKKGQGAPVDVDPGAVPEARAQYRAALDLLAMPVEGDQKDDVRVPAGHFIGCLAMQTTRPWGPWALPSDVCVHPSVPLSGVVRATPDATPDGKKTGLLELVGFGVTGAEAEF